jgi:hypothetical protein
MLSARPGHTIIETIVAMGVGAVVLGLGATIGLRHQRFHRDLVIAVERTEQMEQVAALMPITLRAIAPGLGDIPPGGARDTSLEFRATIATSVVCDTGHATVVLAPVRDAPRLTSILSRPEKGDTAWVLVHDSSPESWSPRPITGVADSVITCGLGGGFPWGSSSAPSVVLRFGSTLPPPGAVVRVTRPWRYSIYRAADRAWYFGAREWNPALGRFNTIQPVGGPFTSGASGLRFVYRDSIGTPIPEGSTEPSGIAMIEVAIAGINQSVIGMRNRPREP